MIDETAESVFAIVTGHVVQTLLLSFLVMLEVLIVAASAMAARTGRANSSKRIVDVLQLAVGGKELLFKLDFI